MNYKLKSIGDLFLHKNIFTIDIYLTMMNIKIKESNYTKVCASRNSKLKAIGMLSLLGFKNEGKNFPLIVNDFATALMDTQK